MTAVRDIDEQYARADGGASIVRRRALQLVVLSMGAFAVGLLIYLAKAPSLDVAEDRASWHGSASAVQH